MLLPTTILNLDPGVEFLPYQPDVDIREYVTVDQVMREFMLGPNGALLKSAEIASKHLVEMKEKIKRLPSPYLLVDTPGQMELFLYRDFGPRFVEEFREIGYIIGVVIVDPTLASMAQDVVSLKLQTLIVQLRLGIDAIAVINKADTLTSDPRLFADTEYLQLKLRENKGLAAEISEKILNLLADYKLATRTPLVSATTGKGLEELYDMLHEIFCTCGDLT